MQRGTAEKKAADFGREYAQQAFQAGGGMRGPWREIGVEGEPTASDFEALARDLGDDQGGLHRDVRIAFEREYSATFKKLATAALNGQRKR